MVDKEKEINIQERYFPYENGNMEGSKISKKDMKREWGLMQYDKRQWIVICCHCNTTRDNVKRCSCSKYENKKNGKKEKLKKN